MSDLGPAQTVKLAQRAREQRDEPAPGQRFDGRLVASLFLNRSLRTRLGVASACAATGAAFLDLPLDRIYPPSLDGPGSPYKNESIADILKVVELHASCFAVRAYGPNPQLRVGAGDALVAELAQRATIPIVNLESDDAHPIQALADLATVMELGPPAGRKIVVAWAYSPEPKPLAVPASFMLAAAAAGADVTVAAPEGFGLPRELVARAQDWAGRAGGRVAETTELRDAVAGAEVLYMKSWRATAGDAAEHAARADAHRWIATEELMAASGAASRYMHCLPADRGYEVADEVIDGERSMVWTQVALRREVTKVLLVRALVEGRARSHMEEGSARWER